MANSETPCLADNCPSQICLNGHLQQQSHEDQRPLNSKSIERPYVLSMEDDAMLARHKWKIGSSIAVYSRGKKQWFDGVIDNIYQSIITNQEWLTVRYDNKSKQIQRFSKYIEPIPIISEMDQKNRHYVFPATHSIKYNHNIHINQSKLSLNNSGYLQLESEYNISMENCLIDLTGYNPNLKDGEIRRHGDILRIRCDTLSLVNTRINISGCKEGAGVNGSCVIVCNELKMDSKSMIYCDDLLDGGNIVIIMDNVLIKRDQYLLFCGYLRQIGLKLKKKWRHKFGELINLYCWSEYNNIDNSIKNKQEIYRFEKMPRIVDKLGRNLNHTRDEDELLLEFLYETGSEMYSYKDWELINRENDKKLQIENVIRFL